MVTWDVTVVLDYLRALDTQNSLKLLTLKTAMLIALATAHRSQTLAAIEINNIHFNTEGAEILITKLIKTSHANRPQPRLKLPFLPEDKGICAASSLQIYLGKTKDLRKSVSNLFISLRPIKNSYQGADSKTIGKWLKEVLESSGLDVSKFKAHSTRHAASSAAFSRGASWDEISKTAGWTANSQVFAKFYNRPIENPGIILQI